MQLTNVVTQKKQKEVEKKAAQRMVATREERIFKTLSPKRTRVYALFLQYAMTIFEPVKTYLQSEAPLIQSLGVLCWIYARTFSSSL